MNLNIEEPKIIDLLVDKKYTHNPQVFDTIYPYIVQVGAGGIGSEVIRQLCQTLSTSDVPHSYIIADPDTISQGNLRNQIFLPEEVGLSKADVLVERYSGAYDLNMFSYSKKYLESVQDVSQLFHNTYLERMDGQNCRFLPILVGCVDNAYTRQILDAVFHAMDSVIYIDAGNESCKMPKDWHNRPKNTWTEEELIEYNESGWTGQVVCGVKLPGDYQPPLAGVMPDINDTIDEIKPSEMSCVQLAASDPQRTIVNKFSSLALMTYLNAIIEDKKIYNHVTHYHGRKGYMRTTDYIPSFV